MITNLHTCYVCFKVQIWQSIKTKSSKGSLCTSATYRDCGKQLFTFLGIGVFMSYTDELTNKAPKKHYFATTTYHSNHGKIVKHKFPHCWISELKLSTHRYLHIWFWTTDCQKQILSLQTSLSQDMLISENLRSVFSVWFVAALLQQMPLSPFDSPS